MRNKSIFIIDDDPGMRDVFSEIFPQDDYKVTVMPNGNGLLDTNHAIPDLYILDKQLSGIDGLDICRFLKSQDRTKNVPIIILSASPNVRPMAKEAGADYFLEKPFSLTELRRIVSGYLAH